MFPHTAMTIDPMEIDQRDTALQVVEQWKLYASRDPSFRKEYHVVAAFLWMRYGHPKRKGNPASAEYSRVDDTRPNAPYQRRTNSTSSTNGPGARAPWLEDPYTKYLGHQIQFPRA